MIAPGRLPLRNGEILAVTIDSRLARLNVVCGEGSILELESVQLEGRKKNSALEFARGARFGTAEGFV